MTFENIITGGAVVGEGGYLAYPSVISTVHRSPSARGVLILCMAVVIRDHRPSHPYNAGTEHAGL